MTNHWTICKKALTLPRQLKNNKLIAKAYLNIGNVYQRKKNFFMSLDYYNKSRELFNKLNNDPVNTINILQNIGVIYYKLKQYDKAEQLLLEANKEAKNKDLNTSIGKIDLTLSSLYLENKKYAQAAEIFR